MDVSIRLDFPCLLFNVLEDRWINWHQSTTQQRRSVQFWSTQHWHMYYTTLNTSAPVRNYFSARITNGSELMIATDKNGSILPTIRQPLAQTPSYSSLTLAVAHAQRASTYTYVKIFNHPHATGFAVAYVTPTLGVPNNIKERRPKWAVLLWIKQLCPKGWWIRWDSFVHPFASQTKLFD